MKVCDGSCKSKQLHRKLLLWHSDPAQDNEKPPRSFPDSIEQKTVDICATHKGNFNRAGPNQLPQVCLYKRRFEMIVYFTTAVLEV